MEDAEADAVDGRYLRTFTLAQIEERVMSRKHVPGYREMLMECAVDKTDDGVVFNIQHPSWVKLISLVREAEQSGSDAARRSRSFRMEASTGTGSSGSESARSRVRSLSQSSLETSSGMRRHQSPFSLEDELRKPVPNANVIRERCSAASITTANRADVWQALLNAKLPNEGSDVQLPECDFDLYNQRVIRMDIQRTRPDVDFFRNDSAVGDALEMMLTLFCKRHLINYKQGLNYIAAPFLFVFGTSRAHDAYSCMSAFIRRFCPNTFTDDQFGGLQCIFRMFRAILLANFLDDNDMSPELYASPWFMTVFANRLPFSVLLYVWDCLMFHHEPLILYFLAAALLISNSDSIRSQSVVVLPEKLTQLSVVSVANVDELFATANNLLSSTPVSFVTYFRSVVSRNVTVDSALYQRIAALECISIAAEEVIGHCYPALNAPPQSPRVAQASPRSALQFFIIDCRPLNHYNSGHLPHAYHLDPTLYMEPEKLARRVESLSSMVGCHFVFLLDSHDSRSRQQFMGLQLFFVQKGFKYVSSCEGGFAACHDLVIHSSADIDLADHNPARCLDCMNTSVPSTDSPIQFKRGFFSSVRSKMSLARVGSPQNRLESPRASVLSSGISDLSIDNRTPNPAYMVPAYGSDYLPQRCAVLDESVEAQMLFCGIRDTNVTPVQYTSCAQRLLSLLVAKAVSDFPIRESATTSANGFPFSARRFERAIVAVGTSSAGRHALEHSLSIFSLCGRISAGVVSFKEEYVKQADGVLKAVNVPVYGDIPDGSRSGLCNILVFIAMVESEAVICDVVNALAQRGFGESCITIVSIIAVRAVLWRLAAAFPELRFIAGAIDRTTKGKVDPGMNPFDKFYCVP
ncbi:hypothetical protein PBRA_001716, partial [Plasmodiophora brassicae]